MIEIYLFIDAILLAKDKITAQKCGQNRVVLLYFSHQHFEHVEGTFVDDDKVGQVFGMGKGGEQDRFQLFDQCTLTKQKRHHQGVWKSYFASIPVKGELKPIKVKWTFYKLKFSNYTIPFRTPLTMLSNGRYCGLFTI